MAKIPRQRTGSGGWPDRRRAVTYTKKGSGGKKGGACGLIALALLSVPVALAAASAAFVRHLIGS